MQHMFSLFILYLLIPFEAALDVSFIFLPLLSHLSLPSPLVLVGLLIYLFVLPVGGALLCLDNSVAAWL